MINSKYGTVLVGENSVLHEGGNLRLYEYFNNGERRLIWPYLVIRKEATFGDTILFNGFAANDSSAYAPFFGFGGTGAVVELSRPLARRISPQSLGATNYAFGVVGITNGIVSLEASQRPPIDRTKPITVVLDIASDEIQKMITSAQIHGEPAKFDSTRYLIAK